ncbi:MAG: hypothetical protein DDT31_00010 [Syntrophomonadaceae bacterium]|nr:hypothetical protein [Bacillota bacterium]
MSGLGTKSDNKQKPKEALRVLGSMSSENARSLVTHQFISELLISAGTKLNPMLLRKHGDEIAHRLKVTRDELPKRLFDIFHGASQPLCKGGHLAGGFQSFKRGYVGEYCKVDGCICRDGVNTFAWKTNPFKLKIAKEKTARTNIEKYGTAYPAKSNEVKEKIKQTNLQRRGVTTNLVLLSNQGAHMKTIQGKTAFSESCLKAHGVSWSSKIPGVTQKALETKKERYGSSLMANPYSALEKAQITRSKSFNEILDGRLQDAKLSLLEPFTGVGGYRKYNIQCQCGCLFQAAVKRDLSMMCPKCFPRSISRHEEWLCKELDKLDIRYYQRNRKLLNGKEIDFIIGDVGIELNGLYWHGEHISGSNARSRHLEKTKAATTLGLTLLQFFEDEVVNSPEIIMSMICSKIGRSTKKYARKLVCREIASRQAADFYQEHHIHGCGLRGGISFALLENEKIIAAMTIRPGHAKRLEISRCAFAKNCVVVGGLNKLIAAARQRVNHDFFTFCDLRFGTAKGWLAAGFEEVHTTTPGYFYVKNGTRFNRQHFQKHKLKDKLDFFKDELSESENMHLNGYDRIWDCGHKLLVLKS